MKTYWGHRTPWGCKVTVERPRGTIGHLDPRFDLANHSPDGFEWGYGGSGPAQLALALLADALEDDDKRALELYQAFKREVVAALQTPLWTMRQDIVLIICNILQNRQ